VHLTRGVAEAVGQRGHAPAVDDAVGDQPHRPRHEVLPQDPLRRAGRDVRPAALAGAEAGASAAAADGWNRQCSKRGIRAGHDGRQEMPVDVTPTWNCPSNRASRLRMKR
jgi:hypothetical protein